MGATQAEGYFVQAGKGVTMTQDDIDRTLLPAGPAGKPRYLVPARAPPAQQMMGRPLTHRPRTGPETTERPTRSEPGGALSSRSEDVSPACEQ